MEAPLAVMRIRECQFGKVDSLSNHIGMVLKRTTQACQGWDLEARGTGNFQFATAWHAVVFTSVEYVKLTRGFKAARPLGIPAIDLSTDRAIPGDAPRSVEVRTTKDEA